jgi:hypothetical protein
MFFDADGFGTFVLRCLLIYLVYLEKHEVCLMVSLMVSRFDGFFDGFLFDGYLV